MNYVIGTTLTEALEGRVYSHEEAQKRLIDYPHKFAWAVNFEVLVDEGTAFPNPLTLNKLSRM